jgi:hypothetical protein
MTARTLGRRSTVADCLRSSFSSLIGGDPLQAEGIRFPCILELAGGASSAAGAVSIASVVLPSFGDEYRVA